MYEGLLLLTHGKIKERRTSYFYILESKVSLFLLWNVTGKGGEKKVGRPETQRDFSEKRERERERGEGEREREREKEKMCTFTFMALQLGRTKTSCSSVYDSRVWKSPIAKMCRNSAGRRRRESFDTVFCQITVPSKTDLLSLDREEGSHCRSACTVHRGKMLTKQGEGS